jgi:hypothetical protein
MFTGGDQDAMFFLLQTSSKFSDRATIFPHTAFNSRIEDLYLSPSSVFIIHFTGSKGQKCQDYHAAKTFLRRNAALCNTLDAAGWALAKQKNTKSSSWRFQFIARRLQLKLSTGLTLFTTTLRRKTRPLGLSARRKNH